ncbi:MAG: formate dehydrogenase subunit gamma, partial [Haliea sp.]
MRKSTEFAAAALLGLAALAFSGGAVGQAAQQGQSSGSQAAPAKALDDPAPAAPASGGIQGQNIFDVKPEVKPDASSEPGYLKQDNAQRAKVQPGNNAPMWRAVGAGAEGFTSLPKSQAPEAGVLVQPFVQYPGSRLTTAGEAWRQVRNEWIIPYGGSLFLIVLLAIAIFYFSRGAIGADGADGGRKIERFTPFERAAHWSNAIAFCVLAISGLVMAFGKFFLLPVMGATLFGWLSYVLKNAHNFAGPLFTVSLAIVFFTFLRDNWPQRGDLRWLLKGGGLLSKGGHEVPSNRFNAGEKLVFWGGVFFLGIIVIASGLVLDQLIPGLVYERATMQIANMVHGVATVLMMCLFAGHIYLGTIGMRGAYKAMR